MAGVDVPGNEHSTVAMQETQPHQPSAATSSSGKRKESTWLENIVKYSERQVVYEILILGYPTTLSYI